MKGFWRFENLARITGGTWWDGASSANDGEATGLSHDTRTLTAGQAYLAVIGEQQDGRKYLKQAAERGAALCIVPTDEEDEEFGVHRWLPSDPGCPVLIVDDAVAALQDLASAYRDVLARSGCRVLGVCGSNGKTTTRHLLHHVLTHCGLKGSQSPKSFNNHLGVPLTLLAARPGEDFVACEIGTNHPGEIAALGEIAWPDAAVVTSIGQEHLAFFKNLEGVAREEAAILPFVRPGGLVATPAEAAGWLMPHYDVQEEVVLLPVRNDAGVPADFPLLGMHNRMNAALVLAVARWWGVDQDRATQALRTATPPPGRLTVRNLGQGVTLLDDSYNANPDSVRAALAVLEASGKGRKVAVLGDMLELGAAGSSAHAAVVEDVRAKGIDLLIGVGPAMGAALTNKLEGPAQEEGAAEGGESAKGSRRYWFENTAAMLESVDKWETSEAGGEILPGDTVLLKGSRGVGLERLIPAFEKRFGGDAGQAKQDL